MSASKAPDSDTHVIALSVMCVSVALSSDSVLEGKPKSFLYPVRKYGGSEAETGRWVSHSTLSHALKYCPSRVSTLEAVAAFMREMAEAPGVAQTLIANMKLQMDRALKQKCKPTIYGTSRGPPPSPQS